MIRSEILKEIAPTIRDHLVVCNIGNAYASSSDDVIGPGSLSSPKKLADDTLDLH